MRTLLALSALLLAISCVGPPRRPPAPATPHVVTPPPPAAAIARAVDWRDWPQTAGDWSYAEAPGGSVARFGTGGETLASLRCDAGSRTVTLGIAPSFPGLAHQAATVRTTSLTRALPLAPDPEGGSAAPLPARDPLLDAIGFSRGRFVVEAAGAEPLVLPAWPEVERVVEDCRG